MKATWWVCVLWEGKKLSMCVYVYVVWMSMRKRRDMRPRAEDEWGVEWSETMRKRREKRCDWQMEEEAYMNMYVCIHTHALLQLSAAVAERWGWLPQRPLNQHSHTSVCVCVSEYTEFSVFSVSNQYWCDQHMWRSITNHNRMKSLSHMVQLQHTHTHTLENDIHSGDRVTS